MAFGVDGVYTFQGIKSRVIKQNFEGWVPHSMGIHSMAHQTNLAVQTLLHLQMMSKIEGLFSISYNYFSKYLKQHLEFSKLFEIMETNWAKIFKNVKTCWTSMLSLTRCVMFKYMTLLMTMGLTMTRQRLILTFFVMSKFYWVLPYYLCYNQFTTRLNSAN